MSVFPCFAKMGHLELDHTQNIKQKQKQKQRKQINKNKQQIHNKFTIIR